MFCPSCGAQFPEGTPYCNKCGERFAQNPLYGSDQQFPWQTQNQYQMDLRANSAATASLVCGIIGLFIAGLILGIIAIVQGNKAKRLGYVGGKATAGITLGVIGLAAWAFIVIFLF